MRVRELAEVSRPETGSAFSAETETAAVVRARLGGAIPEMIEAIARGVPDYASRARPDYQQRLTDAVTGAVAQFIAHVARPDEPELRDPDRRFELQLALRIRTLAGRREPG